MIRPVFYSASILLFAFLSQPVRAQQDDLMKLLESEQEETVDYTIATFKSTKLVSGHSVETNGKRVLQFLISHRFGPVNSGWRDLFGIDGGTMIRISLEYGILDRLNIGLGRSSFQKTYDGFIKYKLLRQSTGKRKMPLTMTLLATSEIRTDEWANPERENYFTSRMYYTFQTLIARKFNDYVSLQVAPMVVHRNLVATNEDHNTVFVLGTGGRVKLTRSLAINLEYYWVPDDQLVSNSSTANDAFSVGIDLETGGHVFQLHFTNSQGMSNRAFSTEGNGKWGDGDIHFGFNISRVFTIGKGKKKNKSLNQEQKPE